MVRLDRLVGLIASGFVGILTGTVSAHRHLKRKRSSISQRWLNHEGHEDHEGHEGEAPFASVPLMLL